MRYVKTVAGEDPQFVPTPVGEKCDKIKTINKNCLSLDNMNPYITH